MEFKGTKEKLICLRDKDVFGNYRSIFRIQTEAKNPTLISEIYSQSSDLTEAKANGVLFACAPEILEMLKYSLILLKETTEHEVLDTFKIKCDTIEELIKKATTI